MQSNKTVSAPTFARLLGSRSSSRLSRPSAFFTGWSLHWPMNLPTTTDWKLSPTNHSGSCPLLTCPMEEEGSSEIS